MNFLLTELNQYTIIDEGFKFELISKYDGAVKINAWEELIEEMCMYIFYYKKKNCFSNKKEKIDFAQGYLKDIANSL